MNTENTGYPAVAYEPELRWDTRLASQRKGVERLPKTCKYQLRQIQITTHLNRCKDAPFVINSGRSGYGDLANWGNPEKEQIISEMITLVRQGYLTYTSEPTGMSRTYSSKDYTFTLTEKGKQFLGINSKQPASDEDVQTAGMRGGFVAEEAERIAHCPSEVESLMPSVHREEHATEENLTVAEKATIEAHLAGAEVARNPEKGAQPQKHTDSDFECETCGHYHHTDEPHLD